MHSHLSFRDLISKSEVPLKSEHMLLGWSPTEATGSRALGRTLSPAT